MGKKKKETREWWSFECHDGNVLVADFRNRKGKRIRIFGGGVTRGADIGSVDLVLNLTGEPDKNIFLNEEAKKKFPELAKVFVSVPMVTIDWPDGESPPVPVETWKRFSEFLQEHNKDMDLLVMCLGGHGRTGTALALILHFLELPQLDGRDVVEYVRDVYCRKAIETESQIEYLKKAGINTKATPSRAETGFSFGKWRYFEI